MPIETLQKLPKKARDLWEATFKTAKAKYSEKRAAQIAWSNVKKKFKKVENKWVAKASDFDVFSTIHYEFQAEELQVTKSEDGFSFVDFYLTSGNRDSQGEALGPLALNEVIDSINRDGLVGRLSDLHSKFYELKYMGLSPDEMEEELRKEDTGIRAIKAIKDGNKVKATIRVAQNLVDKVLQVAGASLEFRAPPEAVRDKIYHAIKPVGFVLTNNPANPDAVRV